MIAPVLAPARPQLRSGTSRSDVEIAVRSELQSRDGTLLGAVCADTGMSAARVAALGGVE